MSENKEQDIETKKIENGTAERKDGIHLGRLCVGVCLVAGILVVLSLSSVYQIAKGSASVGWEIVCLWLLAVLAAVVFLTVIVYRQVIGVLKNYQCSIADNHHIEEQGVYELRQLARVHNASAEQNRELERSLRSKADHDALTGLLNRRGFASLFETLAESGNGRGALMIIDLDFFKEINDTYGHETGDVALKYVAHVLLDSFRSGDLVGRYGGDEFITWMPGITEDHSEFVNNRVRSLNEKLSAGTDTLPPLSISAGVMLSSTRMEFADVFRKADKALYFVKDHGKRGCCIYDRNEVIR